MDMPDYKILLAGFSILIALLTYLPYGWSVLKGKTRPHLFSWALWGLLTCIAFFAQMAEGAGAGAIVTGFTSVMCLVIIAVSLKRGEKNITRSDMMAFAAGLMAIPLWLLTDNPLLAVIMVTLIDALGFYPTFRKSFVRPHEELAFAYAMSGLKFAVSLPALEQFTLVTALYPCSLVLTNWSFVALLLIRRRMLRARNA